jgi:quinol---cytochrome c reductase iron-sulfur subunit
MKDDRRPFADEEVQRLGMFLTVSALVLSFAAVVAFLYVYWTSRNNMLLGGTMAVALAALGAGIVIWAHRLMRHEEASGPREELGSTPADRQGFFEDFVAGERQIQRRRILGWMTTAVLGALVAAVISLFRSLMEAPSPAVLLKPVWHRGDRLVTPEGKLVTADTLANGSTIVVYPEGRTGSISGQTLLIRAEEQLFKLPRERTDWTPKGNVAYSRWCTHAGCPVALYEADLHMLLCPCHQSTFTILDGAQPTSGPAARALPQLPLYVDSDGNLRAGGDFTTPPGPGFWRLPEWSGD